ncbi:MAG: hypothetical protein LBM23_11030 [Propionibacteriaceae bacterium]|jgi:hypothetical protein|nr:hypothetical protein [Propionibacteriaceae bacterium]
MILKDEPMALLPRSLIALLSTAFLLAGGFGPIAAAAFPTDPGIDCSVDPSACDIVFPGGSGGSEESGAGGDDVGGGSGEPRRCWYASIEIHCETGDGTWNDSLECYTRVVSTDPADPGYEAAWRGHEGDEGHVVHCVRRPVGVDGSQINYTGQWDQWIATASAGPSPAAIARAAIARIAWSAPGLGLYPGATLASQPRSRGLVGLPQWFWAADPGPGVASPRTDVVSHDGVTVTATSSLESIVWDPGDGSAPIVCGLGSRPVAGEQRWESPDCGHVYETAGVFTVSATVTLTVAWECLGVSGVEVKTLPAEAGQIRVDEMRVLVVA